MTEEIKKISALPEVTSLVDADVVPVSTLLSTTPITKFITWANIKAVLKTYFDSLYPPQNGWIPSTATWTYSSADSPTFVISVNADMTSIIGVGNRIKLTQTTAKYFIVTAVGSYSAGATLITVYGGTDYTLANASITSPKYSNVKAPFGFNTNPDKWTVTLSDTTLASQATPLAGTWYNLGSLSLSIPIGLWRTYYELAEELIFTTAVVATYGVRATLSTSTSSESDSGLTSSFTIVSPIVTGGAIRATYHREKILSLTSKTTHYLLAYSGIGGTTLSFAGNTLATTVKCVCAYL